MKPENDEDEEPEVAIPEVLPVNLAPDLADEVEEMVDEVEERVDEVEEIGNPPARVERRYATRHVRGIVNNARMIDTRSQEKRGSALLARFNEGRTHKRHFGWTQEEMNFADEFANEYLIHAVMIEEEDKIDAVHVSLKTSRAEMNLNKALRHAKYAKQLYTSAVDELKKMQIKRSLREWVGELPEGAIVLPSRMLRVLIMLADGEFDKAKSR